MIGAPPATGGGGGGAPTTAAYVVLSNNGTLTSERVLTAGSNISLADGGPGSTITISVPGGVFQPLDADLTALSNLSGTNTIYYRSAADTWTAVTISSGLAFSGGNLSVNFDDTVHGNRGGGSLHAAATTSVAGFMSSADKVKLDGVEAGATANATNAFLLARANHTGTQAASTITGLAAIATSGTVSDLGGLGAGVAAQLALPGDGTDVDAMGFRATPVVTFSADTNVIASHNGKCLVHPSTDATNRTLTIQSNAALPLEIGTAFEVINDSANDVVVAITSDTLVQAGTGTTGSVTLNQNGTAYFRKIGATRWYVTVVN